MNDRMCSLLISSEASRRGHAHYRHVQREFPNIRVDTDVIRTGREPKQSIVSPVVAFDGLNNRHRAAAVLVDRSQREYLSLPERFSIAIVYAAGDGAGR